MKSVCKFIAAWKCYSLKRKRERSGCENTMISVEYPPALGIKNKHRRKKQWQ